MATNREKAALEQMMYTTNTHSLPCSSRSSSVAEDFNYGGHHQLHNRVSSRTKSGKWKVDTQEVTTFPTSFQPHRDILTNNHGVRQQWLHYANIHSLPSYLHSPYAAEDFDRGGLRQFGNEVASRKRGRKRRADTQVTVRFPNFQAPYHHGIQANDVVMRQKRFKDATAHSSSFSNHGLACGKYDNSRSEVSQYQIASPPLPPVVRRLPGYTHDEVDVANTLLTAFLPQQRPMNTNCSDGDIGSATSNCTTISASTKEQTPKSLEIPQVEPIETTFTGSISLVTSEDRSRLSDLHAIIRERCVEAYTVSDKKDTGYHFVHIRCVFCKDKPCDQRAERSSSKPSSIKNFYCSIETWQRKHKPLCKFIPDDIKKDLNSLSNRKKTGKRTFWAVSGMMNGMVDTPKGVQYMLPNNDINADILKRLKEAEENQTCLPLVMDKDANITIFLTFILSQMETCQYIEMDWYDNRSHNKETEIGFGGFQCKYCKGKAGCGRFFPASEEKLKDNINRNLHKHLKDCRKCPEHVKRSIATLETDKGKNTRKCLPKFFKHVWGRIRDAERKAKVCQS